MTEQTADRSENPAREPAHAGGDGGGAGSGGIPLPERGGGEAAGGRRDALRGEVTVKLAKQFGFCYGVERAIDLAYAAAKVFTDRRLFILGEIIHNPEVNEQIRALGIKNLIGQNAEARVDDLTGSDVVIVPAFGTDVTTLARIKEIGSDIVDTTCGDVMSVWKRVRQNAQDDMTSVIHGKAAHEETKATASRAMSNGKGHYLVVLTLEDTDYVCDYIRHGGNKEEFLEKFRGAYSERVRPGRASDGGWGWRTRRR